MTFRLNCATAAVQTMIGFAAWSSGDPRSAAASFLFAGAFVCAAAWCLIDAEETAEADKSNTDDGE